MAEDDRPLDAEGPVPLVASAITSRGPIVAATIFALVAGATLRLVWGGDIEFKSDEHWLYELAISAGGVAFPSIGFGPACSCGNSGLSVAVFIALAKISGATTPIGLARAVETLNIVALTSPPCSRGGSWNSAKGRRGCGAWPSRP
jgi:hypothetical protein